MSSESVEDAADDALRDKQFANSQDTLNRLAQEAHEEYLAGLTEDLVSDDFLDTASDHDDFE